MAQWKAFDHGDGVLVHGSYFLFPVHGEPSSDVERILRWISGYLLEEWGAWVGFRSGGDMNLEEVKEILARHREELRERFRVKEMGIFGSYVRGEAKGGSDLDVLVEFEEDAKLSLLDMVGLETELSDLLGVKVDLVEKKNLKPHIGQRILKEAIYV